MIRDTPTMRRVVLVAGVVILLAATFFGLVLGSASAPGSNEPVPAIPFEPQATPPSIQQIGTAILTSHYTSTFYQNGSGMYHTGSKPIKIPSDLASAAYTSLISSTLTLTFALHSGYVPMTNVSQGARTLANATVPYSYTVNPAISATQVIAKIPAVFTAAGATPSVGMYPVYLNTTTEVNYLLSSPTAWVLGNGTVEKLAYSIVPPTGYTMNSVTTFVPFPLGVPANLTNFSVKDNHANLTTFQLVSGGVYIFTTGSSTTQSLVVKFAVLPSLSGPTPSIELTHIHSISGGRYQGNATWVNNYTLPYNGLIVISTLKETNAIIAGTLIVQANGKTIQPTSVAISGNTVQVLPGRLVVNPGKVAVFTLTFKVYGVAPRLSLFDSSTLGTSAITLGELLLVIEVFLIGVIIVEFSRNRRANVGWTWETASRPWWLAVYAFLAVAAVYGILYYV